jgi:glucosamine-6-phosphate deaminase
MNVRVFLDAEQATRATADWLIGELESRATRNIMVAGGNTPLALYAEVARRRPSLSHLSVFALDEYVGVPLEEPLNCANLLRRSVVEAWGIREDQYQYLSSIEAAASHSIQQHEQRICAAGGLDLVVLGLGRNGHIGFNEPGSEADCEGRIVQLDETSIEANREWFHGRFAPHLGVTTGLKTLLEARTVLLLAFGAAKARAVAAMLDGPQTSACPASFLQRHSNLRLVFDDSAKAGRQKSR